MPYKPVEDIAFSVARFFQRCGTFQNYYMYHGGTNFGRNTGGPFISTKAAVYKTGVVCVAFLANISKSDATVNFNGTSYHLVAWSVSILPDCKNVVLNTAKINSASMISSFIREEADSLDDFGSGWSWISEPIGISKTDSFSKVGLLEQINTTANINDYLWYSLSLDIDDPGAQTVLHIESLSHALHSFINRKLAASGTSKRGKDRWWWTGSASKT
ncbi:hypothetical protein VNO77_26871 [Canavalia gladiata]|uniref:Beta-galactosidase beta-sandwich domain-containing protein n=1 Tax=Canavalia gladiata TaxID=3824 RepID=A0AAN9KTT4_CANGL